MRALRRLRASSKANVDFAATRFVYKLAAIDSANGSKEVLDEIRFLPGFENLKIEETSATKVEPPTSGASIVKWRL